MESDLKIKANKLNGIAQDVVERLMLIMQPDHTFDPEDMAYVLQSALVITMSFFIDQDKDEANKLCKLVLNGLHASLHGNGFDVQAPEVIGERIMTIIGGEIH